jgi:hypothetical protein
MAFKLANIARSFDIGHLAAFGLDSSGGRLG